MSAGSEFRPPLYPNIHGGALKLTDGSTGIGIEAAITQADPIKAKLIALAAQFM